MTVSQEKIQPVRHSIVLALCILFAILYGVWVLPHTVFIRHTCMILGAVLSLWVIYPNWRLFLQKRALPIWLIGLLLIWVTFHLLFIGRDFNAQWFEYQRIWKKVALSSIFAMGLGIAIISQAHDAKKTRQYWQIVYIGFLLPMIIYYVKWGATLYLPQWGYAIPKYLLLSPDHMGNPFGVSRAWYVFYCLPAMAIGLGRILHILKSNEFRFIELAPYLLVMPGTVAIFYLEQDRLGTVLSLLLILLTIFSMIKSVFERISLVKIISLLIFIALSFFILYKSFQENPYWKSTLGDAKVAIQIDRLDNWKHPELGLPLNASGAAVIDSSYLRISWGIAGSYLLANNPLGYGKLSLSFGALAKERWPDSNLSWTHSAWLDFALGYGIPGLLFLGLASMLAWSNGKYSPNPWLVLVRWGLGIMALVFLVKEVSFEAPVNTLIFMVILTSALSLGNRDLKVQESTG